LENKIGWLYEDNTETSDIGLSAMSDVHLSLCGSTIPVDHGYVIYRALLRLLPWMEEEMLLGIHPIHGANNGHGELILNHRAKVVRRCATNRLDDLKSLQGQKIELNQLALTIGACTVKPLSQYSPLYAHCVVTNSEDEIEFTRDVMELLGKMDIRSRFICGRRQQVFDGQQIRSGYSLLLHDLPLKHSIHVQQQGIGLLRKLGCGLFIPHKSIIAVGSVASN
jgi:CRISPR-associated protein Cas6